MDDRSPRRKKRTRLRAGLTGIVTLMAMSACSSQSMEVALIAGGGDDPDAITATDIRLDGRVLDLAAGDGVVYLVASRENGEHYLVAIDGDTVTHIEMGDIDRLAHVAAGSKGAVFVANEEEVFRVDGANLEPVAGMSATGAITGLAVGSEGEPVWSESFLGVGPDGEDMVMGRIQRLAGDSVQRVAGVDESPVTTGEANEWAVAPPVDVSASEFPLQSAGPVAADTDGSVYMSTGESILRFSPDGAVEVISGPGDRVVPDEPYADEGEAADFGGAWPNADLDVDDGRVVAVDSALEHEPTEVESFEWEGDLSKGARDLADVIVRRPGADGSFDLDRSQTELERLAVVIDEETAETAAAHVAAVAIDGDTLYLAGQTREDAETGHGDAEILVVSVNTQNG